ncbi:short-chain alcohol dehydrogenase with NAD or NADP as acceptor [Pelagophyceae sp. CCMP2097]|nr:short-chain alcohol dehydrogenase with NAD or NADP as acceptor [Pelagophyceae sp. CCMP2097]
MATDYSIADQTARFENAKATKDERYLNIGSVFDPKFFAGKRVVVTGGNRGLGLEITKRAAASGAEVIVLCRKFGPELDGIATAYDGVDVTDMDAINTWRVVSEKGPIDVLINNAGYFYGPSESVMEGTLNFEEQLKQINICAIGPLRVTSALVQAGGLLPGSRAVVITSQAGSVEWRFTQNPEGGDYGHHMSRAACNIMAALLAQELKSKGVSVVLLHPGFNKTEMTAKYSHIWEIEGAVDASDGAMRVLHEVAGADMDKTGKFINCEDGKEIPW